MENRVFKEYDPEVLRKLQKIQLSILKDFVSVCEKNNLEYFIVSGSAIGVVRHQGFIPWDDDVDVAMPRKDYEKFLRVYKKDMGDKYKVLTPLIDPEYISNVTHLQLEGTTFIPYTSKNIKCHLGINIDIFPLDHLPDDPVKAWVLMTKTWILDKLIFLRGEPEPNIPWTGIKKTVAAAICRLIHITMKVFHVSPVKLYKKLMKESIRYNREPSKYCTIYEFTRPSIGRISKRELYPFRRMPFEDLIVNIPNDYDSYLRRVFGDYTKLPPVEKRVNHCPYKLDFGIYGDTL